MIRVEVNKAVLEAFKAKLKAARDALNSDGPAMRQVAIFLDSWVQRNFSSSGKGAGGWEPYKYGGRLGLKRKSNAKSIDGHHWINTNAKLLLNTGRLRLSFLPFIRKGIAGIGSDLPYAKAHDEGSKSVPQRRILPINKEVQTDVFTILDNFVVVQTRRVS